MIEIDKNDKSLKEEFNFTKKLPSLPTFIENKLINLKTHYVAVFEKLEGDLNSDLENFFLIVPELY